MNIKRTASLLLAAPALLGVLALTGCDDGTAAATAATDTATSSPSAPTTETPPSAAPEDPSEDPAEDPDAGTYDEPAGDLDAGTYDEPAVYTGPELPQSIDLPEQGGTYGVVMFPGEGEAEQDASAATLTNFGELGLPAQVGCFHGASEALGLDEDQIIINLVFADLADAQTFADAYTEHTGVETLGAAEVQTYCMDG